MSSAIHRFNQRSCAFNSNREHEQKPYFGNVRKHCIIHCGDNFDTVSYVETGTDHNKNMTIFVVGTESGMVFRNDIEPDNGPILFLDRDNRFCYGKAVGGRVYALDTNLRTCTHNSHEVLLLFVDSYGSRSRKIFDGFIKSAYDTIKSMRHQFEFVCKNYPAGTDVSPFRDRFETIKDELFFVSNNGDVARISKTKSIEPPPKKVDDIVINADYLIIPCKRVRNQHSVINQLEIV